MEGDSQKPSIDEQAQKSAAFRKLYQAISEVSQIVAGLPITDEDMHHVMAKMDQLNDAFSNLRRVDSQPGSSVSPLHTSPYREGMQSGTDRSESKGQPSSPTYSKSMSLEEKLNALSIETKRNKQEIEKIKAQHKLDLMSLAGTTADGQKAILRRLSNSEEKVQTLVRLQALVSKLHMNVVDRVTLADQVKQLNRDVIKTNQTLETLQTILLEHTTTCSETVSKQSNLVAFHAWTDSMMKYYTIGQTIEFTNVLLNASSCYDGTTSTFTAPVNGMYFFSSSISLCSSFLFTAVIVNNNNEELALFGAPAVQDLQTSSSALAALSKGDKVRVKVYGLNSPEGAQPGGGFSSFLGFLLR